MLSHNDSNSEYRNYKAEDQCVKCQKCGGFRQASKNSTKKWEHEKFTDIWTDREWKWNQGTILELADNKLKVQVKLEEISIRKYNNKHIAPVQIIFNSVWARNSCFREKLKLWGTNTFLSEDLTQEEAHILYETRKLKRDGKIHSTWTRNNKIYVKRVTFHTTACWSWHRKRTLFTSTTWLDCCYSLRVIQPVVPWCLRTYMFRWAMRKT